MTWPNFFIIGTSKAGTTSLYNYLSATKNVFLAPKGKIHYFYPKEFEKKDSKEKFQDIFKNTEGKKAIGEYSGYLDEPKSAELIKSIVSNAKIIICLRDPVERAFSHYLGTLRSKDETLSFTESFNKFMKPINKESEFFRRYIELGMYYEKIKKFLDVFGKDNVMIIIFEEFIIDPKKEFKEVINFLEIDSQIPDIVGKIYNAYAEPLGDLGMNIVKNKFVNKIARKIISKNVRVNLLRLLTNKRSKKPELTKEQRMMLEEFYKKDAKNVEKLLGRKLPWEFIK
jgi:hypothetical protein